MPPDNVYVNVYNVAMKSIAIVVIAGYITLAASASDTQSSDWQQWLQTQTDGFSGVALIAREDAIEVEAAFGLADASASRRNQTDTRFNIGSISKTFTSVAIAQLIQQRRLALDDTLAKHLPDYPNQAAAQRITIRQLLTHRSGVAQFMRAEFGNVDVAAMVKIVGAEPQAFEPGAQQMYSNGGYVVLGRVIEVVSGQSYPTYVAEHVYRPAGITVIGGNPAGGGYTTASDLFRFARALRGGRLLDQRMTEYVLNGTFAEQPRWGFALLEQPVGSRRFIGNGGGAPGVNAQFRFEPAGAYTVVVLANASPPAATNLLNAILKRLAG